MCTPPSPLDHCLILLSHEPRSGWTLSLNKRRFLRLFQQVMVTASKQVSLYFRLFCPFRFTEDVDAVPVDYARRVCKGFAQLGVDPSTCHSQIIDCRPNGLSLGARGTSVLFSSGDVGVGDGNPDPTTQTCVTNNGENQTRFIPTFPASCPL